MDGVVVRGVGVEHGWHGGGADAVPGKRWQRGVVADGAIDDLRLDGEDVKRQRVAGGVIEGHGFIPCCGSICRVILTKPCAVLRHFAVLTLAARFVQNFASIAIQFMQFPALGSKSMRGSRYALTAGHDYGLFGSPLPVISWSGVLC